MDKSKNELVNKIIYVSGTAVAALFLYFGLRQCIYYKIDFIIAYSTSLTILFVSVMILYLYQKKYIKSSLYIATSISLLLFIWSHVFNNYSEVKISPFPLMGIFLIIIMNRIIIDFKSGTIKKLQLTYSIAFLSSIICIYFCNVGLCFSQGQVLKNQVFSYLKDKGNTNNIHSIIEYPDYTIVIFNDEKEIEYRYEFKRGKVIQKSLYTPKDLSVYKNIENKDVLINNK